MQPLHGVTLILVLIGAYILGVKYPSFGQMALSKVGMS